MIRRRCGEEGHRCQVCIMKSEGFNEKVTLGMAIEVGCLHHVQLALSHGAKANNKDSRSGETPLCVAARGGHTEIMYTLIQNGADVNKPATMDNRTPMDFAAQAGEADAVEMLVSHGAKVNVWTSDGWTPMHTAAFRCGQGLEGFCLSWSWQKCGHLETIEKLLEAGANINARSTGRRRGRTPLHQARMYNNKDIVKLLISRGADANARDEYGHTGSP